MSYLTYCLQYNISRRRSCPLLLTKIKITLIMSDKTIPATPQDEGSTDKIKKISHSETGHAKNVANLEDLIIKCESFGAPCNPTNNKLTIAALTALHTLASNSRFYPNRFYLFINFSYYYLYSNVNQLFLV